MKKSNIERKRLVDEDDISIRFLPRECQTLVAEYRNLAPFLDFPRPYLSNHMSLPLDCISSYLKVTLNGLVTTTGQLPGSWLWL